MSENMMWVSKYMKEIAYKHKHEEAITWCQTIRFILEDFEKMKPKDRLEYAKNMVDILHAIQFSLIGWSVWLNGYESANEIKLEEFKKYFEKLKSITTELLTFDLQVTEPKEKKIGESVKVVSTNPFSA